VPQITKNELESIRNQLISEENLIRQFSACAHMASDPQLRTFFEQIAARHTLHRDTLEALLKEG